MRFSYPAPSHPLPLPSVVEIQVASFMRKYGSDGAFPVKIQVPVIMTLNVLLAFKQFTLLAGGVSESSLDSFYSIPEGFTRSEEPEPATATAPTSSSTAAACAAGDTAK